MSSPPNLSIGSFDDGNPSETKPRVPVIIDTDMGWDDWLAILYVMQNPRFELLGVAVTGVGEARLEPAIRNCLKLLDMCGHEHVPVGRGTECALKFSNVFPPTLRNEVDDFFDIPLKDSARSPVDGTISSFYNSILEGAPEPVTILSIGGFTNLGLFLDNKNPGAQILQNVRCIYAMGGALDVPGNVSAFVGYYPTNHTAEWNVFIDVLGAQRVLESRIPMCWVALDACNQVPLTETYMRRLVSEAKTGPAKLAAEILTRKLGPNSEGISVYMFDPLAAVVMADPDGEWITCESTGLRVVQDLVQSDDHSGQTVRDSSAHRMVDICTSVDASHFYDDFIGVLNLT